MAEAIRVKDEGAQGPSLPMVGGLGKLRATWRRFGQFLHDVRVEMRHVTWPTWTDVRATTTMVIITVFFFALFLFLVDLGVSHVVGRVLKTKP